MLYTVTSSFLAISYTPKHLFLPYCSSVKMWKFYFVIIACSWWWNQQLRLQILQRCFFIHFHLTTLSECYILRWAELLHIRQGDLIYESKIKAPLEWPIKTLLWGIISYLIFPFYSWFSLDIQNAWWLGFSIPFFNGASILLLGPLSLPPLF